MSWSVNGHAGSKTMLAPSGSVYYATLGPFATDVVPYPTSSAVVGVTVRATDNAGNVRQTKTSVTLYDCTFI
jgi:hypothetical protein